MVMPGSFSEERIPNGQSAIVGPCEAPAHRLRAQSATEVLVVLAVVLIIAIVAISLLGENIGKAGGVKESQSIAYWSSQTPLAITGWSAGAGNLSLRVRNNGNYPVRITQVLGNGANATLPSQVSIAAGEEATISGISYSSLNPSSPCSSNGSGSGTLTVNNFGLRYDQSVGSGGASSTITKIQQSGNALPLVINCFAPGNGTGGTNNTTSNCGGNCTSGQFCCPSTEQCMEYVYYLGYSVSPEDMCPDFPCSVPCEGLPGYPGSACCQAAQQTQGISYCLPSDAYPSYVSCDACGGWCSMVGEGYSCDIATGQCVTPCGSGNSCPSGYSCCASNQKCYPPSIQACGSQISCFGSWCDSATQMCCWSSQSCVAKVGATCGGQISCYGSWCITGSSIECCPETQSCINVLGGINCGAYTSLCGYLLYNPSSQMCYYGVSPYVVVNNGDTYGSQIACYGSWCNNSTQHCCLSSPYCRPIATPC